jgi:fumarate hydratase class II
LLILSNTTIPERTMTTEFRTEHDSMGELQVPADALWGAQTQRAVDNFPISGLAMPREFIRALGLIKEAAAMANVELGLLDGEKAAAIINASRIVASGEADRHFPIDVFQTGSGTSSNMNANEVISHLANGESDVGVHPNDDVNMGQSSNDVIPTAIQVSASLVATEKLIPSLLHLAETLDIKAEELDAVVKTGRTHLMDAMPVTFGQELGCWSAQIRSNIKRIRSALKRMRN